MSLVLGIDIGTTSVKFNLVNESLKVIFLRYIKD